MSNQQPDTTVLSHFLRAHKQFRQEQRAEEMEGGKQGGKRRYMRAMIRLLLEAKNGLSVEELAKGINVDPKRVIGIGKRLEKQDLITADQLEDGTIIISASEKLRINHTGRQAKLTETQINLLAGFSADEVTQFNGYLKRIIENMGNDETELE